MYPKRPGMSPLDDMEDGSKDFDLDELNCVIEDLRKEREDLKRIKQEELNRDSTRTAAVMSRNSTLPAQQESGQAPSGVETASATSLQVARQPSERDARQPIEGDAILQHNQPAFRSNGTSPLPFPLCLQISRSVPSHLHPPTVSDNLMIIS